MGNEAEGKLDTAAGLPSRHNRACQVKNNPQYKLVIYRPTAVRITLTQMEQTGLAPPEILPVTLYLLRNPHNKIKQVERLDRNLIVADTGASVRERQLVLYLTLRPGTYTILCAAYLAGMEGPFNVQVLSNYLVTLQQFYPPPDLGEAKGLAGKLARKVNEHVDKAADKVNAKLDEAALKAGVAGYAQSNAEEDDSMKQNQGEDDSMKKYDHLL
mmetsp:Transcript_4821/g.6352  ORF Transcript_4821/g.6352 Transcript_4821/m.6352 type:complete len:214 (-) Transcript_4821:158-799(-)